MQFLFRYANPANFMRLSAAVLPFTTIATVLCIATALYLGFSAPPDYQQGRTVLILFIHVPAATVAMSIYGAIPCPTPPRVRPRPWVRCSPPWDW